MKEWITLVDESKTVENLNTIEFNLANAESHDEFRLYIEVDKNANANGTQRNLSINLNGMSLFYYQFNTKWDTKVYKYFELEKKPKPRSIISATSSVSLTSSSLMASLMYNENIGAETGTGKLTFKFPNNYTYTGTIKVQLYAR